MRRRGANLNPVMDARTFLYHLNHITNGKWAEKTCRVCAMCNLKSQPKAQSQFQAAPGESTLLGETNDTIISSSIGPSVIRSRRIRDTRTTAN